MGINAFWYHWLWAWEDGGVGVSASATIRFDPQYGLAQTALSFADGGGYTGIGITGFETRPNPQGPNQPTDFSYDPNFGFPPVVNADLMTTVSAQLFVGGGQAATALLTVFLFD